MLYLLKLSVSLSVIWLFYQLMLRRLTFYNLNRWYLLGYSLLSFIIPLIDIGAFLEKDGIQDAVVIQYIPVIGGYQKKVAAADPGFFSRLDFLNILMGILLTGSVILLARLLSRWLSLRRVRAHARLISEDGIKIFQVDQLILPFSFANANYSNQQLHTEKEYSAIILHEYVHIRQKHTVDMLLSEGVCILNWYNPFAWLIRYSIRQNLEFIADRKVLENGMDRKGYQYHLLQVV
ncbi:MAG: M56 family metallopeptidase, partial [Bacteroidota bacterium]